MGCKPFSSKWLYEDFEIPALGKIEKSFYLLHRAMNKMTDTERFGNLDFVEPAVTVSKSAKKKNSCKVIF